jgi:outer membrane protein TolC
MVFRWSKLLASLLIASHCCASGCGLHRPAACDPGLAYATQRIREVEYPDAQAAPSADIANTPPPLISRGERPPLRAYSLEEAIQTAIANSPVVRDMGGSVLLAPGTIDTIYNPALTETDPRFGIEAALSEFDAQIAAGAYFENNDRAFNNSVAGLGTRFFKQDLNRYNVELRKRTAQGTLLTARQTFVYDFNNSPFNTGPDKPVNWPWGTQLEAEVRQPLLQGAGVEFNRIAGPNGTPGFNRGVLIGRLNLDVSLADFEAAVTQLTSEVENAYWELYFAYRDLDAKMAARERAYDTWRQVSALYEAGPGSQLGAIAEAQSREQLYRLDADVQDALIGRVQEKTNTDVFRGASGVYAAERRLRRIVGLPAADDALLRPADEPTLAGVEFAWEEIVSESLYRRVEIRRQKWQIKRRELELIAARNFLLPRVDAVGLYRFRGLGHDLVGNGSEPFDSAIGDLVTGDYQEWMMGVEMTNPIGYRQGHAAVCNAQLLLQRDRSVLNEQEKEIVSDLSGAITDLKRAHELAQTNYNRRMAALRQLDLLGVLLREADNVEKPRLLDLQLDAQRRLADAESLYYRSLAEYMVSIKNVHLQKGSLLAYNEIHLAEGDWPDKAYRDAARRDRLRVGPTHLDNYIRDPIVVSRGPYPQHIEPPVREELPAPPGEPRIRHLPPVDELSPPTP